MNSGGDENKRLLADMARTTTRVVIELNIGHPVGTDAVRVLASGFENGPMIEALNGEGFEVLFWQVRAADRRDGTRSGVSS